MVACIHFLHALCMHVQNKSMIMRAVTAQPQGQITVSVQTGNYCSNNHLLVPTHIYTRLCHILFMRGTCFLSLLLTYLCSILRVTLLIIVLYNPVHNILIAHCSWSFCLICSAVFVFVLSPFNRVHSLLAYGYFVHPLPFA